MPFIDRVDAGQRLARRLLHLRDQDVVVLGVPRGGVPVAYEVAAELGAPLDVIVVRKLGVPYQPELGMGAIGEDGVRIINDELVRLTGVSDQEVAAAEARERLEVEQRARRFRGERTRVPLEGRTAVIVDDGIATGSTARAACQVARAHGAARVVLAVPVAPPPSIDELCRDADEVVCLETPRWFSAVGQRYRDFGQTPDEQVVALLERAARQTLRNPPSQKEEHMRATVKDRLVVRSNHVGDPDREAVILEVNGRDGAPPYRVRWSDGHESVFFPSSDTIVEHHPTE